MREVYPHTSTGCRQRHLNLNEWTFFATGVQHKRSHSSSSPLCVSFVNDHVDLHWVLPDAFHWEWMGIICPRHSAQKITLLLLSLCHLLMIVLTFTGCCHMHSNWNAQMCFAAGIQHKR